MTVAEAVGVGDRGRRPIGAKLNGLIVPYRVMHGLDPCIQGGRDRDYHSIRAVDWAGLVMITQTSRLDTRVKPAYDAERFAKLA